MSYVDRGIKLALDLAKTSDCPVYKIGAVLMKNNKIVSAKPNIFKKSHSKSRTIFNGIHAEFNCLYNLDPKKCRKCTLFIARITNAGTVSMARSCEECLNLLRKCGIKVFYYTDYNGNTIREAVSERS